MRQTLFRKKITKHQKNIILSFKIIISCFGIAILGLLSSNSTFADNVDFSVNVDPTLVVEVPNGNNISLDLNPNSKTFDSKDMEIIVRTNNITGYQLSMSTTDGNTYLSRDTSGDVTPINAYVETLATNSSGYSDSDFSNCQDINTACMNKWGYKITASDTSASLVTSNYFPFVNNTTISTNHNATNGDSTSMRFAAKINYNQTAGSYKNTLVFTAIATYAAYNINYYNGYDNSSAIATQTDSYNTSSTVKLEPGITPTRSTYTFKSWCLGNNTGVSVNTDTRYNNTAKIYSNPATICNGTEYSTGDNITINPEDYNTNLSLYAVWTPTTFADAYGSTAMTMQNMTSAICDKVTINQYATLTDNRDNQAYTIGKLEDGRCWMADNLNLDVYTYRNSLTASNTHADGTVGSTALTRFKSGGGTTSDRYATGAINSVNSTSGNWTTSYSYSVPLANRSGKCDPSINGSYQCLSPYQNANYTYNTVINKYGTPGSDSSGTANVTYNIGPGSYKIGTYYNFCAASLGSYCWGNGASAGTSATGNATEADICPKGWRLPVGGNVATTNEYQILYNAISAKYSSTKATSTSPFSLQTMLSTPVSGHFTNATAGRQGRLGLFWSSSYYSAAIMYRLDVSGTSVDPQVNYGRNGGLSVRCIAQ